MIHRVETMKDRRMTFAIGALSLLLATGCGKKTSQEAGTASGTTTAPAAAAVTAGGQPVPGNPNPNAAANAAAFEAARKKAEGR